MDLRKVSADNPVFDVLNAMIKAFNELLDGEPNTKLTIEDLCSFQDDDGSFKDHLKQFLENHYDVCPEFHNSVHNILHECNSLFLQKRTRGAWGEDYADEWQALVKSLRVNKRLYIAYGSNMDKSQMASRCPDARVIGRTYIEDWELTMPSYANIEQADGKRTPALIWEITRRDEKKLDRYEGYPDAYDKINIIVNSDGKPVSAMAYVMTDAYRRRIRKPRSGYIEQILRGYRDAGFSEEDFRPRL